MVVVAAEVAVTEETLAVATEAIQADHVMVAAIEETLADHAKAAVTEAHHPQVHVMVADTKVQTHVMAEAEMQLVLQEAMVFLEVIAEARVVTHLQKREALQHHAKAADTKEHVIAAIADHHALQEPIDQPHHAVMQVALQKPLHVTLTKKTNQLLKFGFARG